MQIKSLLLASALALFLSAGPSSAAPCAGFTDVLDTDTFCPSVEWLKNRAITLGCGGPSFCPNDFVTRWQMALFMDRLGTALTPAVAVFQDGGGPIDHDVSTFQCVSAIYKITDFPRTAVATAHFSGMFAGASGLLMNIHYNTDGNAVDFPISMTSLVQRTGASSATYAHASTSAVLALYVGSTYQFAIRVARSGVGTSDLTDFRCHLLVEIHNRRGSPSPPGPSRRTRRSAPSRRDRASS